jgi:hypothetical protein
MSRRRHSSTHDPNKSANKQKGGDERSDDKGNANASAITEGEQDKSRIRKQIDKFFKTPQDGIAVIALIVAVFAAIGTICQAWIARDQEQRQLRAYLSAQIPAKFIEVLPDNTVQIVVAIKDFGQTPGIDARNGSAFEIRPYPMPKDVKIIVPTLVGPAVSVYPQNDLGETITGTLALKATDAQVIDAFASKGQRPYFYGTVHYQDIFGEDRHTNFCFNVLGSLIDRKFGFERCPQFNDSN